MALYVFPIVGGERHGRDRIVVGFTTTYAINSYHVVNSNLARYNNYVIKFVSDLRPVGGFLRVLRFPPQIKLAATI